MTAADVLTLERMRADVADLLGEAPEDIGDDDNLIDLYIAEDSLRSASNRIGWSAGLTLR